MNNSQSIQFRPGQQHSKFTTTLPKTIMSTIIPSTKMWAPRHEQNVKWNVIMRYKGAEALTIELHGCGQYQTYRPGAILNLDLIDRQRSDSMTIHAYLHCTGHGVARRQQACQCRPVKMALQMQIHYTALKPPRVK